MVLSYSSNKFKIFYKNYTKMLHLTNLDFFLSDPAFTVDCWVKIAPDYTVNDFTNVLEGLYS